MLIAMPAASSSSVLLKLAFCQMFTPPNVPVFCQSSGVNYKTNCGMYKMYCGCWLPVVTFTIIFYARFIEKKLLAFWITSLDSSRHYIIVCENMTCIIKINNCSCIAFTQIY